MQGGERLRGGDCLIGWPSLELCRGGRPGVTESGGRSFAWGNQHLRDRSGGPPRYLEVCNMPSPSPYVAEIGQALMGSFSPQAASDMQNEFTQYLSGSSDSPLIVQGGGMWDGLPSTDYSWLNTSSLLSSLNLPPEDWLSSTVSMVEGEFCDGDYIIRGGKIPAVLLGPEFNITLDTGSCEVVSSHDHTNKTLMCTGPSISYAKVLGRGRPSAYVTARTGSLHGNGAPCGMYTS